MQAKFLCPLFRGKIRVTEFGLYASPSYLKKHGKPTHPEELADHKSLNMVFLNARELVKGRETFKLPETGRIRANNLALTKRLVLMGIGISLLDKLNSAEDVMAGRLIRVLPEWKMQSTPLYLVYPSHKFVSTKLRTFMDITAETLAAYMA